MEDGCAIQEGQGKSCNGGVLPAHHREPALLTPEYPPCRRCHGDFTRLSHQGPRRGGVRPQYIFIPQPLPLGGVRGGPPHSEVVLYLEGRYLDFLRIHESADEKAEGLPHCRLGQSIVPAQGVGRFLNRVSGRQQGPPYHLRYVPPPVEDIQGQPEAAGPSPSGTCLPCRPPSPDTAGVQQKLQPGVEEAEYVEMAGL